jgi:hypothetical protein
MFTLKKYILIVRHENMYFIILVFLFILSTSVFILEAHFCAISIISSFQSQHGFIIEHFGNCFDFATTDNCYGKQTPLSNVQQGTLRNLEEFRAF